MESNRAYITEHARERYREITGYKGKMDRTLTVMINMINEAEPFEPDAEYKTKSLIRHGFRPTEYFILKNIVFVVVNGNLVTVFVHKAGDKAMWRHR